MNDHSLQLMFYWLLYLFTNEADAVDPTVTPDCDEEGKMGNLHEDSHVLFSKVF